MNDIRQHKIHFYRQIAFTFIGAAVVVLVGLVYFSLSQAIITVTPRDQSVNADFNVLLKTDGLAEEVDAKVVFAKASVEYEAEADLLEEGEAQQATGTARLVNNSETAQPLVATTRLLSEEGVLFRLKDRVTISANGEVEVVVYADQPGKQGEIGPTRFSIPGLNQARQQEVYAQSDEAMTGGTKSVYLVSEQAVTAAKEAAKLELVAKAKSGLNGEVVLPQGEWVNITKEEVEPEAGSNRQSFTVILEADLAFVLADEEDLKALAQAELKGVSSEGFEFVSESEESFSYRLANVDTEKQSAQVRIFLEGVKRVTLNHPNLHPANFVGMKSLEVVSQLEALEGIDLVEVDLKPFWVRKVPRLVDHVYVRFAQ